MSVVCNTRILQSELTGVQRYLGELLKRMPSLGRIAPGTWARGPWGHAWEQLVLPARLDRRQLLWSPSNVGPLSIRHQVVTLHDIATFEFPEGFSNGFRTVYTQLIPRLLPRVEAVITVSDYTRDRVIERFDLAPERVRTISLAVDHDRFKPPRSDALIEYRRRAGLPDRYILFLGALSARKNLKGLLGGALLFVFPSLYEGFGLPPLEAMACGTPCVVANATSLPEVVGDAAILVDPLDSASIADGLMVVDDPDRLRELAERGLQRARTFDWDRCAQSTLAVLQEFA